MKKLLFLIFSLSLCLTASAQFALQMLVKSFMPATIVFVDGHEETFASVSLPGVSNTIDAFPDAKHKAADKQSFDAKDIECIHYKNEKNPDQVKTLYHITAKKKAILRTSLWGYPIAASEWGVIFKCHPSYSVNKKTGELMGDVIYENGTENPVNCLLLINGQDEAEWFMQQYSYGRTKWFLLKDACRILQNNPELVEKIKKKKIKPDDMQYILDAMAEK